MKEENHPYSFVYWGPFPSFTPARELGQSWLWSPGLTHPTCTHTCTCTRTHMHTLCKKPKHWNRAVCLHTEQEDQCRSECLASCKLLPTSLFVCSHYHSLSSPTTTTSSTTATYTPPNPRGRSSITGSHLTLQHQYTTEITPGRMRVRGYFEENHNKFLHTACLRRRAYIPQLARLSCRESSTREMM